MIITSIERQKKNPKRVNIFCDDEFAAGIHEDVLMKFRLRKGDTLDEEQLRQLQSAEELNLAKQKAFRFMSYRQRSEKELRAKLLEHEFHPSIIEEVTSSLKQTGMLNDRVFAEAYVHDLLMKKPSGGTLIRRQLRLKGIENRIIEDVLKEQLDSETQTSLAREAAKKHMRRYGIARKKHDRLKQQKRLADFLARRGFTWETVAATVKEFFPQNE
jgi:regulatory protein